MFCPVAQWEPEKLDWANDGCHTAKLALSCQRQTLIGPTMAVIGSTLIGLPVKSSNWANNGCYWFDWHWLAREKNLNWANNGCNWLNWHWLASETT